VVLSGIVATLLNLLDIGLWLAIGIAWHTAARKLL
jgi:hypothetical protein